MDMSVRLVLIGFCYGVTAVWFDDPKAEVVQVHKNIKEGDTLVINCTLTRHYDGPLDASYLYFTHEEDHPDALSSDMVHVMDSSTCQLRIHNTTKQDTGFYNCMLNTTTLGTRHERLAYLDFKGFLPDHVTSMQCISEDYSDMTCTWCPDPMPPQLTVWTLTWTAGACIDVPCKHYPDTVRTCTCYFNATSNPGDKCSGDEFLRNTTYSMAVASVNSQGTVTSRLEVTTSVNIVKPSPVKDVRVIALCPNRLMVSWTRHPLTEAGIRVAYRLKVTSDQDEKQVLKTDPDVTSVIIKGLQSDTRYRITIQCHALRATNYSDRVTVYHTTNKDGQEEKRLLNKLKN